MLPPRLPLVAPPLHTPLHCGHLFLVGVFVDWRPSKGHGAFHLIFFIVSFAVPNDTNTSHPTLPDQRASSLQHLICHGSQLLVDCCVSLLIGGHLRAMPCLPLYFLMGLALAPQTREPTMALPNPTTHALSQLMGSGGAMSWRHRCPTHGERG